MPLAKEGFREMLLATLVLGAVAWALSWLHPMAAIFPLIIWGWAISFFRDPRRVGSFADGQMCAPADGTVTEVVKLDDHELIGGPAYRIGIFLSIFNVHINRAPCAGTVKRVIYSPGEYLDARHPESGSRNEANTVILEAAAPHSGTVVVRQVAGLIARRIICHARKGDCLTRGERFGLIKFGSRTELIVPASVDVDIRVKMGDRVRAGLTVMLQTGQSAGDTPSEA
ncbi:MAG: phosphatidylserine decarboxylase family protein [Phycisphaerales bacterium]|nr:phosphatidylserine decarboxylase family protein [Phycisphaerales bacterium]